ncbi:hypothetical protein EMCRGX_G014646 [Ephydatia muelleri]
METVCADEQSTKTLRIKVISMGAAEAGKSCLIKRFCEKRFVPKYMATLGIDFGVTKVKVGDRDIKVDIFDMAGQPFFAEVRNEFYKDTQGAILVFDVSSRTSFEALSSWLGEMKDHVPEPRGLDSVVIAVCGNKVDLGKRKVEEVEGRLWAEARGFLYYETSAQTGMGVADVFQALFAATVAMVTKGEKPSSRYTPEQLSLVQRIHGCQDSYDILGVSRTCSRDEVNKAYKQLAILLHPDKNHAPGSDEAFKAVARAREELLTKR